MLHLPTLDLFTLLLYLWKKIWYPNENKIYKIESQQTILNPRVVSVERDYF